MRIISFEWKGENIAHIEEHSVTPQETEEACYNQPIIRNTRDGLYLVYGQTDAGRYLFIVIRCQQGLVYVITARAMTKSEQRYYRKRR